MTADAAVTNDTVSGREALRPSRDMLVAPGFREALTSLDMTSLDAVFAFDQGRDLAKSNIGSHRRRFQLAVTLPGAKQPTKLYLKRYDRPPRLQQLMHWLRHGRRVSLGCGEHDVACRLASKGIGTPHTVACGQEWGTVFEKRSFLMTREVADSEALERKLPPFFRGSATAKTIRQRRDFIERLAAFVRRFHETGYRHRDLYFAHIFCSTDQTFCVIDLARAFKPILRRRFQIKDLAQLHYSAPQRFFSSADRLRFYRAYVGRESLGPSDRRLLAAVVKKANRMARHSRKHKIPVPFLDPSSEAC
jgi:hypothetical protein